MAFVYSGLKSRETIGSHFKSQHPLGCISEHCIGNLHIYETATNTAEQNIQIMEQQMWPGTQRAAENTNKKAKASHFQN